MSIEGLVGALVLLVIVGFWVGRPLLGQQRRRVMANDALEKQRERVIVYYERVLHNLRDLDEDNATGKMNLGEYEFEREQWVQRGIQALKTLDQLDGHQPVAREDLDLAGIDNAIDRQIEEAVANYRKNL